MVIAQLASAALAAASPVPANPWEVPTATARAIEGYSSQVSVVPGATVALHVSTRPAARYRVDLYRLGWYLRGAARAGSPRANRGRSRPHPVAGAGGVLRAGWPVTDRVRVPRSAASGYYVARLLLTSGPQRGRAQLVPLVVRPRPAARPRVLVVLPANTWEAYNPWGGKSAYAFNSSDGTPAMAVSFDRPYSSVGLGFLPAFAFEYQVVRFLERSKISAGYLADADVDRDPAALGTARVVIVAGHDEYWSRRTRDAYEAARDAGTNLVFLGADIGSWQIRYADRRRTVVAYHDTTRTDPIAPSPDRAASFEQLGRPPCALRGVQFRHFAPLSEHHDLTVTAAGASETGLPVDDALHDLVSYEWDAVVPGCGAPAVLMHYGGPTQDADTVLFSAPSGASIFSAGTLPFDWALDDYGHPGFADARLQRFVRRLLARDQKR